MNRNDLRKVDLNLLIVFETLMHERSVTRAAEKLFLGQPAISAALARLRGLFETADKQLADKAWLAGFRSFADPYFYITLRWAAGTKVDLSGLDNLAAYKARMDADAGVQAALKAEGLA